MLIRASPRTFDTQRSDNFTGHPLPGYSAPECVLRREAAEALKQVQADLARQNLGLKVYDCYRPIRASLAMTAWAHDGSDDAATRRFYPALHKRSLFCARLYRGKIDDTQPAPRLTSHLSDCRSRAHLVLTQPHGMVPAQARRTNGRRITVSTWGPVLTASTQGATEQICRLRRSNGSGAFCCNRRCAGTALPITSANGGTIRFTAHLSRVPTIFQLRPEGDEGPD